MVVGQKQSWIVNWLILLPISYYALPNSCFQMHYNTFIVAKLVLPSQEPNRLYGRIVVLWFDARYSILTFGAALKTDKLKVAKTNELSNSDTEVQPKPAQTSPAKLLSPATRDLNDWFDYWIQYPAYTFPPKNYGNLCDFYLSTKSCRKHLRTASATWYLKDKAQLVFLSNTGIASTFWYHAVTLNESDPKRRPRQAESLNLLLDGLMSCSRLHE